MATDEQRAWIVPVWTKQLSGGPAQLTAYFAVLSDPNAAVDAVRAHIGALEGDEIRQIYPVRGDTIEALGLQSGEVRVV